MFTWLIEVSEDAAELYEGARVVWSMKLEPHQEEGDPSESHRNEGRKSTTRLDVQKDDIQAVVPISKVGQSFIKRSDRFCHFFYNKNEKYKTRSQLSFQLFYAIERKKKKNLTAKTGI